MTMMKGENNGENNDETEESNSIFSTLKEKAAGGMESYFNSQFAACPSCEKSPSFDLKQS